MYRFLLLAVVALGVLPAPCAGAGKPDVREMVAKVDRLYRSRTSYAEVEMEIRTPHWDRTLRMRMWTEGMEKTLIYITYPDKDAGIATLRKGTEMWNYFPKINKVMKVPPSMMMGSWMGSDFTNDDLVKESSLLKDYDASFEEPDTSGVYEIALKPHPDAATVWGKILLRVRQADLIPLRETYFDEKGNRVRVMTFGDVRTFDGRRLPAVMEMTPLNKAGHRTVIRYLKARFDEPMGADVFTLRSLRRQR